jgi:transcriptional regulator with XRE-family HTH domain
MESRALKMFGSKVRELRKERGMSQEALADAANVNRSYLSEIEQGIVSPTIVVVLRLAKAFDVPAAALVDDFTTAMLARLKL